MISIITFPPMQAIILLSNLTSLLLRRLMADTLSTAAIGVAEAPLSLAGPEHGPVVGFQCKRPPSQEMMVHDI